MNQRHRLRFHASWAPIALGLLMVAVFVFLLIRGTGIYPVVFADEWSYSSYARLFPISQAGVPSYLYFLLYRSTSVCGDGFLDCARILNCLFLVGAVPFIYKVARLLASPKVACVVALLAVIGPFNTYAIYFMPESMYFAGFWALTWLTLSKSHWKPLKFGLSVGVGAGLLSLIKVHALFLIPALALYAATLPLLQKSPAGLRRPVGAASSVILAFFATKFILGYLVAGGGALNILGTLYGSQAVERSTSVGVMQLMPRAIYSVTGHLMGLAALFAVPTARLVAWRSPKGADDAAARVELLAVLVFVTLLVVVGAFTAFSEGSGPFESANRLHMRYYNFAFPLLLIIAGGEVCGVPPPTLRSRIVGAGIVVALAACSGFWLLANYTPSMVDSPELRGVSRTALDFLAVAGLGSAIALGWIFRPKWAAQAFLFLLVPAIMILGTWQVGAEVRARQTADAYDEAGIFAKRYLGENVSHLAVVAPHPAPLLRSLFHIDSAAVISRQEPEDTVLNLRTFSMQTEWLLLIGNYELSEDLKSVLRFGSFSLVQIGAVRRIDFTRDKWPGVIRAVGLSRPEAWGTWSDENEVKIEFATTLPNRFELTVVGHAFKGNEVFSVEAGKTSIEARLPEEVDGSSTMRFHTDGSERIISIKIPRPTSPRQIGLNDDTRQLGLGLRELTIKAVH